MRPSDSPDHPSPARHPHGVNPLISELRRGVGPWSALAIALTMGATLVVTADDLDGWQSSWRSVSEVLQPLGLLIGGPMSSAAGCWHGGRERRNRMGELRASGARTPIRQLLLAATPSALWPAVGYLVAAVGALLACSPYAGWGSPFFSVIVVNACALASLGVVGYVIGQLVTWRLLAPVLAGVVFLCLVVPAYVGPEPHWLNPAYQYTPRWDAPLWWYAPASIAWTGGLGTAVFLAYAARRRAIALIPLIVACLAAALLTGDDRPWRLDPNAARLICDDGTPQVCVTAVDQQLLPQVSYALSGVNARLSGIPHAPRRWVDDPGRLQAEDARLPSPEFHSLRGRLREPEEYANWAVGQLFQECWSTHGDGASRLRAGWITRGLVQWLAPSVIFGQGAPWPEAKGYVARLDAKTPAEQRSYLVDYLASTSTDICDPAEVPVP
ncbi:hypothetical protein [Streptomyces albipurpureus]|uniref:Integral membrane protein n=1 Tax=Streptomyces albipurpureus TaxID=2897419 RepID=A0ABT0UIT9_9ACTN|nr:hypothetical protein [Streptomyces sp. CWNU-1]MCM2388010.1 hypothetical protein [Streptomyces sp. CWNU-1]